MGEKMPIGDKGDGASFRVLIIDDSVFVVKQLTQILQSEKFDVIDTANDGEQGVEKYKELHPNIDLVTLDITMPKLDGISTLERIMEFDKDAKVIIISALGKEDLVKKALITGARNYIVKPLDREKVLSRIESVLKK
ncbi:MAG: two-component system response regulator [Spirochaetes bacterium GWD1_27_9]|nr:MAG: two-component system response regulator [Spirochaetes bacterium GWB1_27_13]OHD24420.1 MAG: two-component system response regulator [Spirochaetes bacterium GWC1_27_15]OHD36933.1 MAG: two-component system response regulator [Spirochaetes bacterium GWD1_27_9]